MIDVSNINIENHTADFKCSVHGGSVIGLNLNIDASYDIDESIIYVNGDKLIDPCGCIVQFPTVGGNQDYQDLASAKTE